MRNYLFLLSLLIGVAHAEDVPELQTGNQTPADKAKVTSADIAAAKPREHGPLGLVGQAIPHMDEALKMAIKAYNKTGYIDPIVGDDGTVYYPYGHIPPNISVAASDDTSIRGIQSTIIKFEPGEQVIGVKCKDPRFNAEFQNDGIATVDVSAKYSGLNTTLLIKTAKKGELRLYNLFLTSVDLRDLYRKTKASKAAAAKKHGIPTAAPFIPQVAFFFPDSGWQIDRNVAMSTQATQSVPAQLASDFRCLPTGNAERTEYKFSGDDKLRPLYVTNDQTHTYIQMPPGIQDVPVIAFVNEDDKEQTLNVGMANGCYIVPRLADEFLLKLGDMKMTIKRDTGWF